MTPPVFYVDPSRLSGDSLVLDGPEGRHAAVVRRVTKGERVDLSDGAGNVAECVVARVDEATVHLSVVDRRSEPAPRPRLVVVQALVKGAAEDAVTSMTEVGVDQIVPWAAERAIVQWEGARGEKSRARWQSAAREAGKQSRRARFPDVTELATTADVAARLRAASLGVVLHESATRSLATAAVPPAGDVIVVVGPEGGITDEELAAFTAVGAAACRMGPTVLRAATAGTAAAATLLSRTPRWS